MVRHIPDSELMEMINSLIEETDLRPEIIRVADNYDKTKSINVEYKDILLLGDDKLSTYIYEEPKQFFRCAKKVISNKLPQEHADKDIYLRIKNSPDAWRVKIKDLKKTHLHKFISIDGIVVKKTQTVPQVIKSVWICTRCGSKTIKRSEGQELEEPTKCADCDKPKNKTNFKLIRDECDYRDYQEMILQDPPEILKGGEEPTRMKCIMKEDMVDKVNTGDHVIVNGILDGIHKQRSRKGTYSRTVSRHIEVNTIDVKNTEYEEIDLTDEDMEKIEELSQEEDVFEKVVSSIAPSVGGMKDVKRGLALQLFGGIRKTMSDGQNNRGDMHILLVGDPGVAKSQLLKYMGRVSPRGMYSSGKGTTEAGLTAAAMQEEVMGEKKWTLEAGTLVLADRGLAAIDEIDKMRDNDRQALHEAMEQQTVTQDKAGLHATLNARCSILAAGNPREGRFDIHTNLLEQINLPPPLMSRFDLIFPIRDVISEERDEKIATHINELHADATKAHNDSEYEPKDEFKPLIESEVLRKYISHAKTISPHTPKHIRQKRVEYYKKMRQGGEDGVRATITPRQLESLIRMMEASARVHLRHTVNMEDYEIATNVMDTFLKDTISTKDGLDIDKVASNVDHEDRTRMQFIRDIITGYETEYEDGVPISVFDEEIENTDFDPVEIRKELKTMRENGVLFCPQNDRYKFT